MQLVLAILAALMTALAQQTSICTFSPICEAAENGLSTCCDLTGTLTCVGTTRVYSACPPNSVCTQEPVPVGHLPFAECTTEVCFLIEFANSIQDNQLR
jgi:hypothetical protein